MMNSTDIGVLKPHQCDQIRPGCGEACDADDKEYVNVFRGDNTIKYQDVNHPLGSAKINQSNNIQAIAASTASEHFSVPQPCVQTVGVPTTETAVLTSTPSTSRTRKRPSYQPKFDDPVREKKRLDSITRAQMHREKAKLEKKQMTEKLKRTLEEKEELQAEVKRLKTDNQALKQKNVELEEELQTMMAALRSEIQAQENLKIRNEKLANEVQTLTRQNELGLLNEEHLRLIDFDITPDLLE